MNLQEFDDLAKAGKVKATLSSSVLKIPRHVERIFGSSSGFIRFRFKGDGFDTMCGTGSVIFTIKP